MKPLESQNVDLFKYVEEHGYKLTLAEEYIENEEDIETEENDIMNVVQQVIFIEKLNKIATETNLSKEEIFKRAIALMDIVVSANLNGKKLGITDDDSFPGLEIVGF